MTAKGQSTITQKNSQGKVVAVTDAAGNITSMSYDIRGRKTGEVDPFDWIVNPIFKWISAGSCCN